MNWVGENGTSLAKLHFATFYVHAIETIVVCLRDFAWTGTDVYNLDSLSSIRKYTFCN